MMKRTTWKFDMRVVEETDRAEYASLVEVINKMQPMGEATGRAFQGDRYEITIEMVECP